MKLIFIFAAFSLFEAKKCIIGLHGMNSKCSSIFKRESILFKGEQYFFRCANVYQGLSSATRPIKKQSEAACEYVQKSHCSEVYLVGFSQGALIANYIVGQCSLRNQKIRGLLSFAGINRGIYSTSGCFHCFSSPFLTYMGYKRSLNKADFLEDDSFVTSVTNEKSRFNPHIKQRFLSLEKIILAENKEDTVLVPKETALFQFNTREAMVFEENRFFSEDRLGLLELFSKGRVYSFELEGNHTETPGNSMEGLLSLLLTDCVDKENMRLASKSSSLEEVYLNFVKSTRKYAPETLFTNQMKGKSAENQRNTHVLSIFSKLKHQMRLKYSLKPKGNQFKSYLKSKSLDDLLLRRNKLL